MLEIFDYSPDEPLALAGDVLFALLPSNIYWGSKVLAILQEARDRGELEQVAAAFVSGLSVLARSYDNQDAASLFIVNDLIAKCHLERPSGTTRH